jgi:hypothetical protein
MEGSSVCDPLTLSGILQARALNLTAFLNSERLPLVLADSSAITLKSISSEKRFVNWCDFARAVPPENTIWNPSILIPLITLST